MTLKNFYLIHQPKLESFLNDHTDRIIKNYPMQTGRQGITWVRESLTQGKMMRGMLVLMSAHMHGIEVTDEMYHIASAMELIHMAFLIHDDIIDDDLQRRNQDSLYYRYIKEGQRYRVSDKKRYGMAMAMCLGDMVFFLAFDILTHNIKDPQHLSTIVKYISREIQHIGPAQMMDASFAFVSDEPTEEEIDQVYTYKTAHYTFSLPLILGATFSPQSDSALLKNIGRELGIIFQLRDDELGIYGTAGTIGKPIGSDIRENKKTYMRHLLFSHIIGEDNHKLRKLFGKKELSADDLKYVRQAFEAYGITAKILHKIRLHNKRLESLISELSSSGIDISLLQDLSSYILTRKT